MDIVDQLKLMRNGKTTPFPRSVTLREAGETIDRLRAAIHEAEFCLTVAVIPDGHDRCKLALAKLRAHEQSADKEG